MSFEEEFDRIIRRKAEEEQYPFDEGNWDKANSMLDAERMALRAAKIKKMVLPTVLTAVLGTSLMVGYNYMGSDATQQTAEVITASEQQQANSSEAKVLRFNAANNANTNSNNSTSNPGEANDQITTLSKLDNITQAPAVSAETAAETTPAETTAADKAEKTAAREKGQSLSTAVATSKEASSLNTKKEKEEATKPFSEEPSGKASAQDMANTAQHKKADQAPGVIEEHSAMPAKEEQGVVTTKDTEQAPAASQEENSTVTWNAAAESRLEADELNLRAAALPYELNEGELMPSQFAYLQRYDDYYSKKPRKHYMNLEAGANYLLGWEAPKGKDAKGLNWYAGINYGYYLSHKVSFGLGIQAYTIANIKQPYYLVTSKEYGFGSTNIYTRVTTNELVYVGVPLKINYAFNKTNTIGVGFNAAYLAAAKNSVSKYYLLDNEEKHIGPAVTHNSDIYEGTSRFNMMLSAHYHTRFGKRIGLNLECTYGLTDLFANMSGITTEEKPVGIRLGVTYTLFDK